VKAEDIYGRWAPTESIWSQWVIPVPFAQIQPALPDTHTTLVSKESEWWFPGSGGTDSALVVDLPGKLAIEYGLAVARRGMRPVPVIDGSPFPSEDWCDSPGAFKVAVEMGELSNELRRGAELLAGQHIAPDAPPAFLLDANRDNGGVPPAREMFDNRWKTFPQDYPSARLLNERGIRRVIVIQEKVGEPREDLQHVLLRWQEAGLEIYAQGVRERSDPRAMRVAKPSWYRASWYRAMAMTGLRRGVFGGFGNWPHGTGGG
jgi:hypothetical protein